MPETSVGMVIQPEITALQLLIVRVGVNLARASHAPSRLHALV
jgi:hypothetical protein